MTAQYRGALHEIGMLRAEINCLRAELDEARKERDQALHAAEANTMELCRAWRERDAALARAEAAERDRDTLARGRREEAAAADARPLVVCICGSTRFIEAWNEWRKRLTLAGEIVLAIEIVTAQRPEEDPQLVAPDVKARLDELHKRKIDLADYVFVLDVGGYVGQSTRSEIAYAQALRKPVKYLSRERAVAAQAASKPARPATEYCGTCMECQTDSEPTICPQGPPDLPKHAVCACEKVSCPEFAEPGKDGR